MTVNPTVPSGNGHKRVADRNLEPFLTELTELSRKYKIGIAGDPLLRLQMLNQSQVEAWNTRPADSRVWDEAKLASHIVNAIWHAERTQWQRIIAARSHRRA